MKTFFLAGLLLAGSTALAQQPAPISPRPLQSAGQAQQQLFLLPEQDSAYYFQVNLPGSSFLTVRFNRLSYWESGRLGEIFRLAKESALSLKDSFTGATTSRRIALHVPPSNTPVTAALREWGQEERILLLRGSSAQPLRIAADTISILKTGAGTGEPLPQLQYTFLLKDLEDIAAFADDAQLVQEVEGRLDSLVAAKRAGWRRPDAAYHRLFAVYDVPAQKLRTGRPGRVNDLLVLSGYFGLNFVGGTMAPSTMLGIHYQNNGYGSRPFVGLTINTLAFYRTEGEKLRIRSSTYLNLEFGGSQSDRGLYRTAAGFGYQISSRDPGPYDAKFHLYFSFSISKAISLVPDCYVSFANNRNSGDAPSFFGLTVLVRAF